MNHNQMSENFITGSILAVVGGFLDAYTYLCRGKVFANAQTGNIVLFGAELAKKDFSGAAHYACPILAFAAGIVIAELIKDKYKKIQMVHWRQIVVVLEIIMLVIVANIPNGEWNFIANIIISFVCSLQVQSFRKVNGYAYASTMCTGNLRSATERMVHYYETKDKAELKAGIHYYGIIVAFIIGAAVGAVLTDFYAVKSVYIATIGLAIVVLLMAYKRKPIEQVK